MIFGPIYYVTFSRKTYKRPFSVNFYLKIPLKLSINRQVSSQVRGLPRQTIESRQQVTPVVGPCEVGCTRQQRIIEQQCSMLNYCHGTLVSFFENVKNNRQKQSEVHQPRHCQHWLFTHPAWKSSSFHNWVAHRQYCLPSILYFNIRQWSNTIRYDKTS